MILELESVYKSLENLVKMQILIQKSWAEAQNPASLTISQVMPMPLVQDHTLSSKERSRAGVCKLQPAPIWPMRYWSLHS